jgi:ADP-ribose pyrophosphatase
MSDEPGWPRVVSHTETTVSPWVRLVAREVRFRPDGPAEVYHSLAVADYLAVVARTPDGLVPLVRQFRPAVGGHTWELPAGLLDAGEAPEDAARRELLEETGLTALAVRPLGAWRPDTGRLTNRQHVFLVEASAPDPLFAGEEGVQVAFVTVDGLRERIRSGEMDHMLHVAAVYLAELAGFLG